MFSCTQYPARHEVVAVDLVTPSPRPPEMDWVLHYCFHLPRYVYRTPTSTSSAAQRSGFPLACTLPRLLFQAHSSAPTPFLESNSICHSPPLQPTLPRPKSTKGHHLCCNRHLPTASRTAASTPLYTTSPTASLFHPNNPRPRPTRTPPATLPIICISPSSRTRRTCLQL